MNLMVDLNRERYRLIDVNTDVVWDFIEVIKDGDGFKLGYRVIKKFAVYSKRYDKYVIVSDKEILDGATDGKLGFIIIDVPDLESFGWPSHDMLCRYGEFSDGTKCNNWQASRFLTDVMKLEGFWFRCRTWMYATWLVGGGKSRENGMF